MTESELTPKERQLLELIARHFQTHHRPPTQTGAAKELRRSQGAIRYGLKRLTEKGHILWTPHVALGIAMTEKGWEAVSMRPAEEEPPTEIPDATAIRGGDLLLLPEYGSINAGQLDREHQETLGYFPWPISLGAREGCFVLRVKGDSMVDAHILPGSRVILDPKLTPQSGDVVAVLLNGESTLKRLHFDARGNAILVAENSEKQYPPILVRKRDAATIQGVVIHIVTTPDTRRRD
jgi:SOS-response transcriptional repressor LexA